MSTKENLAQEGTPSKSAPDSQPGTGTPAARLGRTRTSPAFAAEMVARDVWSQANGFYAVAFNLRCSGDNDNYAAALEHTAATFLRAALENYERVLKW